MPSPKPTSRADSPKKYRVLVIDDEASVLQSLEGVLSGDVQVVTSTSAAQALSLLVQQDFHVVCSDYRMPGMNGIDLLRRVSERPVYTSCLLITGADEYFRSSESGRYYVLLKPFDPERLIGIVLQLARVAEMKRQLASSSPPAAASSSAPSASSSAPAEAEEGQATGAAASLGTRSA